MKIGIIVSSRTGHTLEVAHMLEEELCARGHQVVLERIETAEKETQILQ
jgi:flavodoxin